ncbi:MAG TPA: 3-hydroxyacyl-CoA dehydrogenase family protein, partial [Deinococcales bacterium]|nr:3-hydroxyacyl-CoA dehydrogenase family protein [Deinococcales bacterium]
SATLRTADLTGLDVAATVAAGLKAATRYDFEPPKVQARLIEDGRLGEKTGAGFYKRVKRDGQSVILTLNPETLDYEERPKVRLAELEPIRALPTAMERLKALLKLPGVHGDFMRRTTYALLRFAAENVPEITPDVNAVDDALRWGFGWEAGPFETIRALGVENVLAEFAARGWETPALLRGGSLPEAPREPRPGVLVLKDVKADPERVLKRSGGASLLDIGDGVALLEFHSKANALGEDALGMLQHAMKVVPQHFAGLVIGNDGEYFSAGANLAALLFNAQEGEWDEVDRSIRLFQRATTGLRTAPFPVVVAPFDRTLGGGAELTLYATQVQAHAELYMGLVEMGVGLIPAGGGTTELLARYSAQVLPGEDPFTAVKLAFERIALAKVSASALEARAWGYLRDADGVVFNRERLTGEAKKAVLNLADGFVPRQLDAAIPALGESALAKLKLGIYGLVQARQASDYDAEAATILARVLSGGSLNYATAFPAQHFLDLEREAFLTLCGKRKTQERIAHTLKTGKPLRN